MRHEEVFLGGWLLGGGDARTEEESGEIVG